MPYLDVATNVEASPEARTQFLQEASRILATGTGKPEQYVMVRVADAMPILFARTDAPAAFLEVKSIGYPASGVSPLAAALCRLVENHFTIPGDRIYIVFVDVKAAMWGQGGETFG
jgi:phenylpyruvate tautomerase PptA (4-oxalocrotonate tautomerase family)